MAADGTLSGSAGPGIRNTIHAEVPWSVSACPSSPLLELWIVAALVSVSGPGVPQALLTARVHTAGLSAAESIIIDPDSLLGSLVWAW